MDKKKIATIVLVVMALVCVGAVLFFGDFFNFERTQEVEQTTEAENIFSSEDYLTAIKVQQENTLPYLKTDIQDVYFTISDAGEVKFYKFADNMFTAVESSGTYDISVKMSAQTVDATVTYYEEEGKIAGYGLYTGQTSGYDHYPYAFLRLTQFGENIKGVSSSFLLLIDTNEEDFYSNDKIYEEPFIFNPGNGSCKNYLSVKNRTIGVNGSMRSDYTILNDTVIKGEADYQLFFSGRHYPEDDERVDLMKSGGRGNNLDNVRLVKDVIGYWAKKVDSAIMYLAVDENGNVTLNKYNTGSEKSEVVKTFDGVGRNDILVSGDYLYIISKNSVYSLLEDTQVELQYKNKSIFTAETFVCENGMFILTGTVEGENPVCVAASLEDGSLKGAYENEFFATVFNTVCLGDGKIMLSAQENGKFSYFIF